MKIKTKLSQNNSQTHEEEKSGEDDISIKDKNLLDIMYIFNNPDFDEINNKVEEAMEDCQHKFHRFM